ncbi:MAG TPA: glutathione S-transferase N-terminal domain-containing protein [Nevskiaceae bacterium]|nr:glutathione S-transferase N-terminal domain-containing protein [Nevskiaceae bacterium]
MASPVDTLLNSFAGTARAWRGTMAFVQNAPPEQPLKLYDIEVSPYCRLVREVLTELDLDVMILPCPSRGTRFRPEAERIGGKQQFPLLVDENTGTTMYESADIIDYLARTYGGRPSPRGLKRQLAVTTSYTSSLLMLRPTGVAGMKARPSRAPAQPLELYSFESSPYSKPVRARLCELEIPYLLRNTGKGGWKDMGPPNFRDNLFKGEQGTTRNRRWLAENTGRVQVPYLVDPNTGAAMYESAEILAYLDRTYGA